MITSTSLVEELGWRGIQFEVRTASVGNACADCQAALGSFFSNFSCDLASVERNGPILRIPVCKFGVTVLPLAVFSGDIQSVAYNTRKVQAASAINVLNIVFSQILFGFK